MGTAVIVNSMANGAIPGGSSYATDPAVDATLAAKLKDVHDKVTAGLPDESDRIQAAQANAAYYRLENKAYIEKREAETDKDYGLRPKRTSKMTRKAIDVLAGKLYSPGPSRTFGDTSFAEWFAEQYEATRVNVVMDSANRRAILNDCCAIQVICTGDEDKPFRLYTFDAAEFAVYCKQDDPTQPWCVVTIAIEAAGIGKKRRVYTVWTAQQIRTYKTKEKAVFETTGGIVAMLDKAEPNPYGCLPFAFFHNETPVDRFWGSGIGDALRETNAEIDRELSDLAQQIQVFSCPDAFVRGVPSTFRYEKRPGRPQNLTSTSQTIEGENTIEPEFFYVQPNLVIESVWWDIERSINTCFSDLGIPLATSLREQNAPQSGIQVIAEQIPLLDYLKCRAMTVGPVETDLARLIARCVGTFYQNATLAADADTITVDLVWPEPSVPVPTPEADATDAWELSYGLVSPIQVIMRRRGMTRQQAVDMAEQIKKDNDQWTAMFPDQTVGTPIAPPAPETGYSGVALDGSGQMAADDTGMDQPTT